MNDAQSHDNSPSTGVERRGAMKTIAPVVLIVLGVLAATVVLLIGTVVLLRGTA